MNLTARRRCFRCRAPAASSVPITRSFSQRPNPRAGVAATRRLLPVEMGSTAVSRVLPATKRIPLKAYRSPSPVVMTVQRHHLKAAAGGSRVCRPIGRSSTGRRAGRERPQHGRGGPSGACTAQVSDPDSVERVPLIPHSEGWDVKGSVMNDVWLVESRA
jgi:hypothetical protein